MHAAKHTCKGEACLPAEACQDAMPIAEESMPCGADSDAMAAVHQHNN